MPFLNRAQALSQPTPPHKGASCAPSHRDRSLVGHSCSLSESAKSSSDCELSLSVCMSSSSLPLVWLPIWTGLLSYCTLLLGRDVHPPSPPLSPPPSILQISYHRLMARCKQRGGGDQPAELPRGGAEPIGRKSKPLFFLLLEGSHVEECGPVCRGSRQKDGHACLYTLDMKVL